MHLPEDVATQPYRSTDATGIVVVEGQGKSTIGAAIFQFSDRVVQEKLDFWREQRGNA